MDLVAPLSISQIEAANKLHHKLPQWQITDRALLASLSCTNREVWLARMYQEWRSKPKARFGAEVSSLFLERK
jgi:hypothetical protein